MAGTQEGGGPAAKRPRLSDNRVAAMPSGGNFIEVDGKTCTHEVAWPPGQSGSALPPPTRAGPPARDYSFKLDPFQQTAINVLEAGHSVLVAAHTSAGKTVVAEYAFAMALRDGQRVIYTSPLKALSNQKYREFQEQYGDVGLMTGDVTINPNASCLVMTTEIFRSMLYRGSEVVREVALIVYDEIHYLRDRERGVVWEESIILAPPSARFAFLSATIPNARQFADWVAKTHGSPCHVVYTDYRPTPLEHYIFPAGGQGLYLAVDDRGTFREDSFQKAVAALNDATPGAKPKAGKRGDKKAGPDVPGDQPDISKIVSLIAERHYDPAIVFSFSKKECEALANAMVSLDLNGDDEKKLVEGVFHSAMDVLSEEDRALPQIQHALPMLRRGIGVHHSGLLPIVKEVIEILFQEGLLKVLFATETFSTGLNMPAKTVVFTSVRKFDGTGFRWVSSGEYIQMSGRAGRRGLDDKGVVILMLDAKMDPALAKDMIKGAPDTLYSEFHLEYNMLLSLLRCEGVEPEALMRRSYRQFQAEAALPALEAKAAALQAEHDAVAIPQEEQVAELLALTDQLDRLRAELAAAVHAPKHALPFLQPGRLVRVAADAAEASGGRGGAAAVPATAAAAPLEEGVWGAVVNFERVGKQGADGSGGEAGGKKAEKKGASYLVDVLVACSPGSVGQPGRRAVPVPASTEGGVPLVVPVQLAEVTALSSLRVYIPKDLRTPEARTLGVKSLGEVARRFPNGVPVLDPEEDMKIEDESVRRLQRKAEGLEAMRDQHPLSSSPSAGSRLEELRRKQALREAARAARREAKAAQGLILHDDLKARRKVLKRLGYVDEEGVVTLKGRVASEIRTGDELVLCELIFGGAFSELSPEQICCLVSCFVWQEKSEVGIKLRPDLEAPYAALKEAARRVARVAADCKVAIDPEEYVASFRPDLSELVGAWCRGARFADLLKMSGCLFEGSIVRAVRRLEELLRQLAAALTAVGDTDLAARFEEGIEKIKRDIIFSASLYL